MRSSCSISSVIQQPEDRRTLQTSGARAADKQAKSKNSPVVTRERYDEIVKHFLQAELGEVDPQH